MTIQASIQQAWSGFRDKVFNLSRREKRFVFFALLCSFFISAEGAIARPVSNSIFLSAYTSRLLPYAWMAVIPSNLFFVWSYNHLLPKVGCLRTCLTTIVFAITFHLFCVFYLSQITALPFIFYLWKDVCVLLLYQQLWSVIHATMNMSQAKYLYGILFGAGGIGSVLGSFFPTYLATRIGSEYLLLLTLPLFLGVFLAYTLLLKERKHLIGVEEISLKKNENSHPLAHMKEGWGMITQSPWLKYILLIVMLMQFAACLISFQFSLHIERHLPIRDVRTAFCGKLFGSLNGVNLLLQFIGGSLMLQWLGLKNSHLFIPFLLTCNALCVLFMPGFATVALSFATIKAMDYSLFGIVKEMLYIPLKVGEKFKAKSLIDVFAFRASKGVASFAVLLIQWCAPYSVDMVVSWGLLVIFSSWAFATVWTFNRHSLPEEESLEEMPSAESLL